MVVSDSRSENNGSWFESLLARCRSELYVVIAPPMPSVSEEGSDSEVWSDREELNR